MHAIHTLRCVSIAADTSPIFVRTDISAFLLSSLRTDWLAQSAAKTGTAGSGGGGGGAAAGTGSGNTLTVPKSGRAAPQPTGSGGGLTIIIDEKYGKSPLSPSSTVTSAVNTHSPHAAGLGGGGSDDPDAPPSDEQLLVSLIREQTQLLYHLTRFPEMAIDLASKGLVTLALQLLAVTDVNSRRLVYGVFSNLARYEKSQTVLVEQGTIYELVTHLEQQHRQLSLNEDSKSARGSPRVSSSSAQDAEIEQLIGWTFTTLLTHERCRSHLFKVCTTCCLARFA